MPDEQYIQLLKESRRELFSEPLPLTRKKRRKIKDGAVNEVNTLRESTNEQISDKISDSDSDSYDSDDFEDVDLGGTSMEMFGLEDMDNKNKKPAIDSFTISISKPKNEAKKASRKIKIINADERKFRKLYHQLYLAAMIMHGSVRNMWCNDYRIMMKLKQIIPVKVLELLMQKEDNRIINSVKSRRFLDGIRMLMEVYRKRFRITSKGLIRKNWNELSIPQDKTEKNVSFDKFAYLLASFKGSKDIGAQGFVCLLRSIGLRARLVFSLQPPDFTSTTSYPKIKIPNSKDTKKNKEQKQNSTLSKFRRADSKSTFLSNVRQNSSTSSETTPNYKFEDSPYPIFWTEVWNKFTKKWVSVDPIVLELLESAPMRRKSKFEPPGSQERNQLIYVIAYDKMGGVKDVTRRYSQYYNAKTIKKKIIFKSEKDEDWYERIVKAVANPLRTSKVSNNDILELKEFRDRDLAEGMPNNLADFRNHPIYALECQLRQNEIIFPKNEMSVCGTFRNKSFGRSKKSQPEVFQVYKRSSVHSLKSVKAWFLRGRVLKIGEQPLKLKRKSSGLQKSLSNNDDDDDDDDDDNEEVTRLYAEFQTKLYIPQPIIDGKIPKNSYGNIDVYTQTMIPENGYLLDTTNEYPIKLAQKAAGDILKIDYAKAIVAFDFGNRNGGKRKHNKIPTVREGGIIIDKQYKEALIAVLDCLLEEEEELMRERVELNSLKNWMLILKKLRISDRLNKEHGKIDTNNDSYSSGSNSEYDDEKTLANNSPFEVGNDAIESNMNEYIDNEEKKFSSGGFMLDNENEKYVNLDDSSENNRDVLHSDNESNESFGGGFLPNDPDEILENRVALFEKKGDDESIDEEDESPEESFGGGFFFNDSGEISENETATFEKVGEDENINDDECVMPDEFFKCDDNGELLYDPSPVDTVSKNKSNSIGLDPVDGWESIGQKLSSNGNTADQSEYLDGSQSKDSTPKEIQNITNHSEMPEPRDSDNNIFERVLSKDEDELNAGGFSKEVPIADPELATEEELFNFEYSDSE